MAIVATFERSLKFLVPSWLSEGEGGKALIAVARILDENVARARAALELRFPSRAQDDANAKTGEDRGIVRGRSETSEHYAKRLIAWRFPRGHRVRGSAFALLNQVSEYFGGIYCWTIDVQGNRHVRAADGTESSSYSYAWDWDGTTTPKGRFWLVLRLQGIISPLPLIGDPALWGGAIGPAAAATATIGMSGVSSFDAAAMRRLLYGDVPWRPAGTLGVFAVITFDSATPVPNSNWKNWPGRAVNYRYWSLEP